MKAKMLLVAAAVAASLTAGASMAAGGGENGDKKIGRVYFKMVCTVCHMTQAGKAIPPNTRSMSEWRAYLDANKHDKTGKSNRSVRNYLDQEYRKSIQDKNKAAQKFVSVPNDQMYAHVRTFLVSGAKDSDTPASCE